MRYEGRLKKWNTERGFGFIAADDGGAELFVHISAFARDRRTPTIGEALSFEVEPGRDGKKRAVHVLRPGEQAVSRSEPRHNVRRHSAERESDPGFFRRLLAGLLVCALAWLAYGQYAKRAARYDSALPAPPLSLSSAKLPVPSDFRCDGRNMCSQMTSCREATLFLQNCPGMKLDGNGDGVPCEQQWCGK
mgnify:CR=1 FL=1